MISTRAAGTAIVNLAAACLVMGLSAACSTSSGPDAGGGVVSDAPSLAAAANSDTAEPESAAAQAGGDVSTGAAVCKALPATELSSLLGAPVDGGVVSGAADDQCTWTASGDAGSARVQVLAADTWQAQPGEPVPGVAGDSYVVQLLGGWVASAATTKHVVVVFLTGPKASASTAGSLLKLALSRV